MTNDIDAHRRGVGLGFVALLAAALLLLATGCAEPCGPGTEAVDGRCVPSAAGCGAGTMLEGGVCVPSVCAEGARYDVATGKCVLDGDVVCGANTRLGADGTCIAEACGPRTVRNDDGRCVIGSEVCGAGTQLDAATGECVQSTIVCDSPLVFDAEAQSCRPGEEICGPGARFDADVSMCLSDACRPGDVLANGICATPAEELAANPDYTTAEHDDPSTGGTANPIDIGTDVGDERSFYGAIEPAVDRDADGRPEQDVDAFAFTAQAGTWLDVSVQALGIPSAAFVVRGPRGFERWSTVDAGLTNARLIVTPYTGEYTIEVTPTAWATEALVPGREYIEVGPFGDEDWDYVGTVRRRDSPAPLLESFGANNEVSVRGKAGDPVDTYIELDGYAHPFVSLDVLPSSPSDEFEAMVWAEGATEARSASTDGDDIGLRADGNIDRVFIERRVARAGDAADIEARLVGPYELGTVDEGDVATSDPVGVDAPVFVVDAPAGGVVEISHDANGGRPFDLVRAGEVLIDGEEVDRTEFLTGYAGDTAERWYITVPSQRDSGWTLTARGPSVVDMPPLAQGESFVDDTLPSCSGMKHYRVRPDAGSLLTSVSTTPVRWLDLTATSRGMEQRIVADPANRRFTAQVDGTTTWVISVECNLRSATDYRFTSELGPVRDTDMGVVAANGIASHDESAVRSGETVPVQFTVPARSAFDVTHIASGGRRVDLALFDAGGEEIASEIAADSALRHYAYTQQTFEVRMTADASIADLRLNIDVSPIPTSIDSVALSPRQQSGDVGKQAWLVELRTPSIFQSTNLASTNVGRIEIVDPVSGAPALDIRHRFGESFAVPLPAGHWLVLVSGSVPPQSNFSIQSTPAVVTRDAMVSPPAVFEPVQRAIPVGCAGAVDDVRIALQGPSTIDMPYVVLTSPSGTNVGLHEGGYASPYLQENGYILPDQPAAGDLDRFVGEPAAGDWLVTLYSSTNDRAVLDAVGLEVSCTP